MNCRRGCGGGGGGAAWKSKHTIVEKVKRGSRGGRAGGPDSPGKSQVKWCSIGNKQLDPLPLKKLDPPPPPAGKSWTLSGTLKNDSFLRN